MVSRAERRRILRESGRHRSRDRRGRREPVRAVKAVAHEIDTEALKAAGFVIVRPKLQVPGSQ